MLTVNSKSRKKASHVLQLSLTVTMVLSLEQLPQRNAYLDIVM